MCYKQHIFTYLIGWTGAIEKRHQNSIVARIIYDYPRYDRCFQNRDPFVRLRSKIEGSTFGRYSNPDRQLMSP